jgi:hypothetical protein
MNNCLYYTAHIPKEQIIHFVALLRSMDDNIVFDRIEDAKTNIFEFFVPEKTKIRFEELINTLQKNGYIDWLKEMNIEQSSLYKNKLL